MVFQEVVVAPRVLFLCFRGTPHCIPFDEKNTKTSKFATESALEVIEALEIARQNEFVIPVPNGITAEERNKLERYNKKVIQKSRIGFNLLVQSMGTSAVYQNVISASCKIGNLKGAWDAIWDKYDSKKPAMQSPLPMNFPMNELHMPDGTVEQFLNRLNDICARMMNDPGKSMKKTQVIKGISNEFATFAQIEARRDMSWAEYCASIRDQATQFADISLFRDKRKQMIAAERVRLQSSDRSGGGDEPTEDYVNFVSDRGRMKRRGKDESGAKSARDTRALSVRFATRRRRDTETTNPTTNESTRSCECELTTRRHRALMGRRVID